MPEAMPGSSQVDDDKVSETALIPPGFVDLLNAFHKRDAQHNVIGVCTDFLEIAKTKGPDYTIKFILHDQHWLDSSGMTFRFFHKDRNLLPAIESQGDVVILRNIKTKEWSGFVGLSNSATRWVVLPFAALEGSFEDLRSQAKWMGQGDGSGYPKPALSIEEYKYAKYIAKKEDPSQWKPLVGSTSLQVESIMKDSGGKAPVRKDRFREIMDIQPPSYDEEGIWVELLGEVRKIYSTDIKTELSVTDYTVNSHLHDYRYGDNEDGRDGDQFGYVTEDTKLWPGPWGTMTMVVTLWDTHHKFTVTNVKEGNFVFLRNVRIKWDKNHTKLEGIVNGDRFNSSQVNVELREAREAGQDNLLKALLKRKREYEAAAKTENIRFVCDAQNKKRKPDTMQEPQDGDPKSKKSKVRGRKRKQGRSKESPEQGAEKTKSLHEQRHLITNLNVRCQNYDVPSKTITDILDSSILERKTPAGSAFFLPFQNCKYKSKVRVVDFFPDNIEDFAIPQKETAYDHLSDSGSNPASDVDLSREDENQLKWTWRFFLLVEDARPQQAAGERPAQMQLLVADTDGDYLLNQEAFNMRDKKNAVDLAMVKEKLFHLWGDLQERKEEASAAEALQERPKARPFECLIKEYGAAVPSYLKKSGHKDIEYERMFRLFGVTI